MFICRKFKRVQEDATVLSFLLCCKYILDEERYYIMTFSFRSVTIQKPDRRFISDVIS